MAARERTRLLRTVAPTMPDAPKRPYLEGRRDPGLTSTCVFMFVCFVLGLAVGVGVLLT